MKKLIIGIVAVVLVFIGTQKVGAKAKNYWSLVRHDRDGHAEVQLIINGNTHCYVVLGDKGAYGVQPVAISCVRVK